jgi:hypothetical protein
MLTKWGTFKEKEVENQYGTYHEDLLLNYMKIMLCLVFLYFLVDIVWILQALANSSSLRDCLIILIGDAILSLLYLGFFFLLKKYPKLGSTCFTSLIPSLMLVIYTELEFLCQDKTIPTQQ